MPNISNTMTITDSSLSSISKELINKRVYKEGLIKTVGNPVIYNGIASNLNTTNGIYAPINLLPTKKVVIRAKGVLSNTPNDAPQPAAQQLVSYTQNRNRSIETRVGTKSVNFLRFLSTDTSLAVPTPILKNGDVIEVEAIVTHTSLTGNVWVNNQFYTKTITGDFFYSTDPITSIFIGNGNIGGKWYWTGTIDLASVALYIDDELVYTPSARNYFKFNKIMISDKFYSLTDTSTPILNHVYECEVTEISRTENNVLLTATIPEDIYLSINQLGLYYSDDNGTHIFSIIDNLSLKKTNDLTYNLIIHVKLDINVVNTVAVPEIVIKEKPYTNFSKFSTVKQVYAYIVENMERIIKLNALGKGSYTNGIMTETKPVGVGYNTAQVYYRLQNNLTLCKDNFTATNNYAKVKAKFTPYTTETFSSINITKIGDVFLNEQTGLLSTFSVNNYASTNIFQISTNKEWKLTVGFTTSGDISTKQSVITISSNSVGQPLALGIENNKCTLKIDAIDEALVTDGNNTHTFKREGESIIENTRYYRWTTYSNITNNTILTTIYSEITASTPVYDTEGNVLPGWQFTEQINDSIMNNPTLFSVNELKKYMVTVEYKNNIYYVSYTVDGTNHPNIFSVASNKSLNSTNQALFGVGYTGGYTQNPFSGTIDLYNTELINSEYNNGTIDVYTSNFLNVIPFEKSLLDYFHIPIYTHSYFLVNNLGFEGISYLEEYEGTFKGLHDRINFNNPKGMTLCTKVILHDEDNKVLLAKGNLETNRYYFILEQKNNSLIFTLYLDSATIVLKKEFTERTIRSFVEHPINVTVTCDGNQYSPTFKFYKNNELLDSYILPTNSNRNISGMYLMNHEAITADENLEVHTVYDILSFEGELSPSEIYYINNILDTNF